MHKNILFLLFSQFSCSFCFPYISRVRFKVRPWLCRQLFNVSENEDVYLHGRALWLHNSANLQIIYDFGWLVLQQGSSVNRSSVSTSANHESVKCVGHKSFINRGGRGSNGALDPPARHLIEQKVTGFPLPPLSLPSFSIFYHILYSHHTTFRWSPSR